MATWRDFEQKSPSGLQEPHESPAPKQRSARNGAAPPSSAHGEAGYDLQHYVIGGLLIGGKWSDIAHMVRVEDFSPPHRLIVTAIATLAADGKPHDPMMVSRQLEHTGHLEAAGGIAYLSSTARETATAANLRAHAQSLRERALMAQLGVSDERELQQRRRALAEIESLKTPTVPDHYPIERLDTASASARPALMQGLGLDLGTVNAVIGEPNSGKTAFVVSLATHIAAGCRDWLGLKITCGPVLYIAAEAPGSVKFRAKAAVARLAIQKQLPLYVSAAVPALGGDRTSDFDTQHVIATVRYIRDLEDTPVVLVVIDTLASCLGTGEENGSGMTLLTNAAKAITAATGACVILVHHPSKKDGSAARGHGSFAAACDSIILVEQEAPDSGEVRAAKLIKARDHATGGQARFALIPVALSERDSFGDPLTTVVVEPADGIPRPQRRPSGQQQDTLLIDLERQRRGGKAHFTEAEIIESAKALGLADRNRNAPRNALRGLIRGGFVTGSPASYALTFSPAESSI